MRCLMSDTDESSSWDRVGAGAGVGDGMGGICLSIHPRRYMYMYMYCTQRSVESEHLFLAGKLFLCFFFSWIAWGNLQQQQKEKCFGSFYIFFWRGRFWYCCCCCWVLLGSLSLFLFPERASLEEGLKERKERREERKAI